jgi:hypothetical protein
MREIDEFPDDDDESHLEVSGTKVKDSKEHSLTIEERNEIISKYNAEHSKHGTTSDEGEKIEQSDRSMIDSGDFSDRLIQKLDWYSESHGKSSESNIKVEPVTPIDECERPIARSTKSVHSLLNEHPLSVEKLSERSTDEIHEKRIDRLNLSSDISNLTIISQEVSNYLTMISALSATTILDGILRYGGSDERLDGQDRLPAREVKYAVPDLFSKFISQLWLVSRGDISRPLSKFVDNLDRKLLDTTNKDSLFSLKKEVALEEEARLTKSVLLALDKEQNRNTSIVSFGPKDGFDALITDILKTTESPLNLATQERVKVIEQTRSAFQNLVAKVFGELALGESSSSRILFMVGVGITPLAWHIGKEGEVNPIEARFGPNAEDTRNTLSFFGEHIGRPALFDVLVDTKLLTMQVRKSYILSDTMWEFLSGFFDKYDNYNLKNAYQYLLKYGILNQYSKHFSNSSGTEIWSIDTTKTQDSSKSWNPDFLRAAQILGMFLIPSYASGITTADMTRTILALLSGNSEFEVRVAKSLLGKGPFKESVSMSIPVDRGSAYWTDIQLDPSVSEWAERSPHSLLQQMYVTARLEIAKHMGEGMLEYKIVDSGTDTSTEIDLVDIWNKEIPDSDSTVFSEAHNVWRASFNADENLDSTSNFAHMMFQLYQENSISVMRSEVIKLFGMSSDDILERTRPIKAHISSNLHIAWGIVETLQGAAEISLGIIKHYPKHESPPNKWGGMGGEKLARCQSMGTVRTVRLLELVENGERFNLMLDEKIPRKNYNGTMIPFVPLLYVENRDVVRQVPLLIKMRGFGKGKTLLNPELFWDIDKLLKDHPRWDTICEYRENMDWSNFAVSILESLSDIFQGNPQKMLESIDILRFARETTRYMMVAKETPITARSAYMTKDGFPITLATSLFPYSYEHLGGALGQLYSNIFDKHNLPTIAGHLKMDLHESDAIRILPYSFIVTSEDSEKSSEGETAADSRLLLWVESPDGQISQERILKLSYKTAIQSVNDKVQYTSQGLSWAFRDDKNDPATPILQVFDRYWVGLSDTGWLIRDIRFLNTEEIDPNLQKAAFIKKVDLLRHRLTSSLSISDWLGVEVTDILETHKEITELVQKFGTISYIPTMKIPERSISGWAFKMNRQGSLLERIRDFQEQLISFAKKFPQV